MPNVQPPGTYGLAIGYNYFLYSPNGANCTPITGLTITINVTQDIVWQSSPQGGGQGFAFQLNAFSSIGTTPVPGGLNAIFPPCGPGVTVTCGPPVTNIIPGWQQFIFYVNTSNPGQTDFGGQFENWPASPSFAAYANPSPPPAYLTGSDLINLSQDAGTLSTEGISGIPAGFQLVISLGTDSGNNVNSATFTATNNTITNGPSVSDDNNSSGDEFERYLSSTIG